MTQSLIVNRQSSVPSIRTIGDPILHTVCTDVLQSDDLSFLEDLRATCLALHPAHAAGLSAPQIGVAKRAIFIRYGKDHGLLMVNPKISGVAGPIQLQREGCLSNPGFEAEVARYFDVSCAWDTPDLRQRLSRQFKGFEARVLQHEIDHLDGICIWDQSKEFQRRDAETQRRLWPRINRKSKISTGGAL